MWGGTATDVIHNGVDTSTWCPGAGGNRSGVVWAGRFVAEKAPHLAIRAARLAGLPITLAGPIGDEPYFERYVRQELRRGDVRWLGPLPAARLADLFRTAAVGVVSPVWDEPFCLVAAEMLACGLPVATFARGGIPEFVRPHVGALAAPGDVGSLAEAILRADSLSSASCAEFARHELSQSSMADRYETVYRDIVRRRGGAGGRDDRSVRATA